MFKIEPNIHAKYRNLTDNTAFKEISDLINPYSKRKITLKRKQEEYLEVLTRHYLYGYFYEALDLVSIMPNSLHEEVSEKRKKKQLRMLSITAETLNLNQICNENNIEALFIKGAAFSVLCFDDPGKKLSIDVDMLIKISDLEKLEKVLCSKGYKKIDPPFELSPRQKKYHIKTTHHISYINPKNKVPIEIHWKLLSPNSIFPFSFKEINKNKITIDIAGNKTQTIEPALQSMYLIAHGSKHIWSRLQWLLEAYLMYKKGGSKFDYIWEESKKRGTEIQIVIFFSLLNIIWNIPIPDMQYGNVRKVNKMIISSLNEMLISQEKVLFRGFSRFRRPIFMSNLNRSFTHKLSSFLKISTNAKDWEHLKLPDSLFFLYFPLRPFIWFWDVYLK